MKYRELLFSVFLFSAFTVLAQVPVNKRVVVRLAQNKKLCLEKNDSLKLQLSTYAELAPQEWRILPSTEDGFYYLKTLDDYNLVLDLDTTQIVNSCHLTIAEPDSDIYKFKFQQDGKQWSIIPKLNPDLCLQSYKSGNLIYAIPKQEFGTSNFVIDTIPARRPKPRMQNFSAMACEAGLLIDEKPVMLFGADATYFKSNLYPAQYIIRIYLSQDRKDRIDVIVFDDLRQVRQEKVYSIKFKGPKTQPIVSLIKNDKDVDRLDEAICKVLNINWRDNTIEFRLEGAHKASESKPIYDFIYKGLIRMQ